MSKEQEIARREMPGLILLWNYPEIWWRRRNWLARLVLVALVVGLISAVSIAVYDGRVRKEHVRLLELQTEKIDELSRLIAEVRGEREEVQKEQESEVLGEIEKVKEELRDLQLETSSSQTPVLNNSVEDALRALELAYPSTGSGEYEF